MSMTLLLLPNVLDEALAHELFFPRQIDSLVQDLSGLIAESERGGRRFLRRFKKRLPIALLNEHTKEQEIVDLLNPIFKGERWGLISDAGLPCLADPGSQLVQKARCRGICIEVCVGPSSLYLSLMLSGLPAQAFAFHGYLPQDKNQLVKKLRLLEERSIKEHATQLFIEAPYRNQQLLNVLVDTLSDATFLCIAVDLTLPTESVATRTIAEWKKQLLPNLNDRPAVFLLLRERR
jgi:16S rRNA (cytidine1402-2'-O)-methyltransferase